MITPAAGSCPEQKIIDVFICKLRKKLGNASGRRDYIETMWGRAHMLREPSDEDAAPLAAAVDHTWA